MSYSFEDLSDVLLQNYRENSSINGSSVLGGQSQISGMNQNGFSNNLRGIKNSGMRRNESYSKLSTNSHEGSQGRSTSQNQSQGLTVQQLLKHNLNYQSNIRNNFGSKQKNQINEEIHEEDMDDGQNETRFNTQRKSPQLTSANHNSLLQDLKEKERINTSTTVTVTAKKADQRIQNEMKRPGPANEQPVNPRKNKSINRN